MTNQAIGRLFEDEFSAELGLRRVPGSGNQWHSQLDVEGRGALWSLKATRSASISGEDFEEAIAATFGPGGDGNMPLMALRFFAGTEKQIDLVLMGKDEFLSVARGEYVLARETKTDAKRRLASIPELLRDEED